MKARKFFAEYGVYVALVLLIVLSAAIRPDIFLRPETFRNVLSQNVDVGLVALAMTLVIVAGGIDLSVGSLLALVGTLGVLVMKQGFSPPLEAQASWIACGVMVGAGALFGALNGFLVTVGKVVPFIATLVGLLAYRSLTSALAEGGTTNSVSETWFPQIIQVGLPLPFLPMRSGQPLIIPWVVFGLVAFAFLTWFLLEKTPFGRHCVAVGANEKAAHYSAISVGKVRFWTYVFLGSAVGMAAVVSASRTNSVSSGSTGAFLELDAIAAVVIGGTALNGGKGRVWGTLAGVILLGLISTMLVAMGVSVYWQGVLKGLIILAAVLLQGREGS